MPISWGSPSCLQAVLGVSVAAAALAVGPVLHLPRWRLRTPIVSPAMAITLSVLEFHSLRETVMFVDVWFVVSYYGGEIVDPQFFRIDPQAPVLALVVRRRDFPTLSEPLLRSFSEAAKPGGLLFYLYDVLPRTGKPHTDTPCSDPRVSKNGQAMANLDQTVYAGYGGGRLEWSSDVRFAIPAG